MAAEEGNAAAIGSVVASELYGLKTLCANIEDISNNVTRFLVVSKDDARPTGDDKTAILFSTAHKAGALADVLKVMKKYEVNLTNIESRPSKKRQFEYYFFVDFQGHKEAPRIQKALRDLEKDCIFLKVLGSYPKESC